MDNCIVRKSEVFHLSWMQANPTLPIYDVLKLRHELEEFGFSNVQLVHDENGKLWAASLGADRAAFDEGEVGQIFEDIVQKYIKVMPAKAVDGRRRKAMYSNL